MLKKVRVDQKGDTNLLPGQFVDRHEFRKINDAVIGEGKEGAQAEEIILGITKASLATDSFLSAASFQETTKVLTDAALEGKIDRLAGLKENVIIGKLIPAATGLKRYRTIEIEPAEPLPRGIDDVGLLEGDDLAAELGLDDGEGLQGFGPAFDTAELEEIGSGFGTTGGGFDDLGDLGDVGPRVGRRLQEVAAGSRGRPRGGRPRRLVCSGSSRGGWWCVHEELELPRWPAALDGLRVGVLTDLHAGMPHAGFDAVERAAEALAAEQPDLVCLLGDFIDRRAVFARPVDAERADRRAWRRWRRRRAASSPCSATTTGTRARGGSPTRSSTRE